MIERMLSYIATTVAIVLSVVLYYSTHRLHEEHLYLLNLTKDHKAKSDSPH